MKTLLLPEELKEMTSRIDEIPDILRIQNGIVSHMLTQSTKFGCQLHGLWNLGNKLDAMKNSLEVMSDFVRFK